jgi:hypothetical protein
LLLDGAPHSIHSANKLDQYPVARTFDDSSTMLGDVGLEKFSAVSVEARERALLVSPHQPAIASDISGENGGEPPLDLSVGHVVRSRAWLSAAYRNLVAAAIGHVNKLSRAFASAGRV